MLDLGKFGNLTRRQLLAWEKVVEYSGHISLCQNMLSAHYVVQWNPKHFRPGELGVRLFASIRGLSYVYPQAWN